MNSKAINDMIVSIIEHKQTLTTLTYDNPKYDKIEDKLHDLEDEFLDMYGDTFEEILDNIHDKLESENEVLLPIAYMASSYAISVDDKGNKTYDIKAGDGILIDTNKYVGKRKSLVLVPSPLRFVLLVDNKKEVVWQA